MRKKMEQLIKPLGQKWKQRHMANTLGDNNDEIEQVFELYENLSEMLGKYCEKRGDEGFGLMCLATAVGMTLNDIADEIEEADPECKVREDIAGRVTRFIFVNKKMMGH